MSTTIKTGWLHDKNGDKFAPKTLTSQVQTSTGILLEDHINELIDVKMAAEISGIHIGEEAPTDGSEVWIDTDEEAASGGGASIDVMAEVGQTIVVKEVDENGKPTKWETAEHQEKICSESIVPIVSDVSVEIYEEGFGGFEPTFDIVVGRQYVMTINGTAYVGTAIEQDGMAMIMDTVNMVGIMNNGDSMVLVAPYPSQTITLSVEEHNIIKIPETYLPHTVKRYVITLTDEDELDGLAVGVKSCTYDSFIDILYGGGEVIIKKTSQFDGPYGGAHYFKPVSWSYMRYEDSGGEHSILGISIVDNVKVFGASSEKINLLFNGIGVPPEL